MTDAEHIMDAMGELPTDLIEPVAALRAHPVPRRLRRWMAIAACLVLVVGLGTVAASFGPFFAQSENAKQESANDVTPSGFIYRARVKEVCNDYLVVGYADAVAAFSVPVKVYLDALAETPELAEGDLIVIYYDGIIHRDEESSEHYIDDIYYIEKVGSE